MFRYVVRNIRGRMMRTAMTVLGIAVCIQLFAVIRAIVDFTVADLEAEMAKYGGQAYVRSPVAESASGQSFPPVDSTIGAEDGRAVLELVKDRIQAELSTPVLFRVLANPLYPNGPPQALAVGVEPGREKAYTGDVRAVQGSASPSGPRTVVLGSAAAAFYGVTSVGQTIDIAGERFEVVGLLEAGNRVVDPLVLMNLADAQDVFAMQSTYSAVLLTVARLDDVGAVREEIERRFGRLDVMTQDEIANNISASLQGTRTFMSSISATVAGAAIIVVLIVMTMAIMERTKEIGVLRAIGADGRHIVRAVVAEASAMSLAGGAVGVGLAYLVLAFVFGAPDFFTWSVVLQALAAAVAVGVVASLYPAVRAVRILPQEALRYE